MKGTPVIRRLLLNLRAMATIFFEFAQDATAFGDPRFRNPAADRIQPGVIEKIGIAIAARLPDRSMPGHDGKVGAETRAFSPQHGVGSFLVAEAGSRFDAVDAIAPVADPEAEVSFLHQESDIGLDVAVACAPAELRASGDHPSALAGERRRRQHLFQGGAGLLLCVPVDQVVEREVGSDIATMVMARVKWPKCACSACKPVRSRLPAKRANVFRP